MLKDKFISAVILAAGNSTRMGRDKITADLRGKTVLLYSIECFLNSNADEIILVVSKANYDRVQAMAKSLDSPKPIKVVLGGNTRAGSAINALNAVNTKSDVISVHDGARPLVTAELCNNVFESAIENGGAIAAVWVKDTVKKVENGFITATPERKHLMLAQTPQAFTVDIYKKAMDNVFKNGIEITDDASAAELVGCKVAVVESDYCNIKLTSPEDFIMAEAFLNG